MKEVIQKPSLRDADPKGRVDVALFKLGEQIATHCGAEKIWNGGLGDFCDTVIQNLVPSKPITPADIARELGLAGKKR